MSEWQHFDSAPRDGSPFLAWEVVVCDEEDEDGFVVARNQKHERPVIVQWIDIFECFTEARGHACPSNGAWIYWRPIEAPGPVAI